MLATRAAALVLATAGALAACGEAPAPSLLLVSLDTTRRDHLSSYGYRRETTPALDRLARAGVVFENAFAQQTNTGPSHASIFSGLHPHAHGVTHNRVRLRHDVPVLAEILRARGWSTGAFVGGSPMRARATGFERGFARYDDDFPERRRPACEVVARAREWLARQRRPWLLFVHLYDAHGPYEPPAPWATHFPADGPPRRLTGIPPYQQLADARGEPIVELGEYVARYDGAIRYADECLAPLYESAQREDAVVVVLADHGESLGERQRPLDHGGAVFDEQIRIPLVLRAPGLAPARFEAPVQSVDLLPTLLELLAVPPPQGLVLHGRSLLPLLRGAAATGERPVFAMARAVPERHVDRGYALDRARSIESVRTSRWKLIRYPGLERDYFELYDLAADPGETRDVSGEQRDVRERLLQELERWQRGARPAGAPPPLDAGAEEQLRSLGYVE